MQRHDHEMPAAWEESGAGFSCPTCGAGFDSEEDLVAHQAMGHHRDRARDRDAGARVRPSGPRDQRPPRHWPQG
ncbi:MAG: hypothetical protein ACE14W_08310 [Candidatus Velamenicoccus archaeovorus]